MSRVVDTDVVSYLYKDDSRAALYHPHLFGQVAIIGFQTRAELYRWALTANWGERKQQHFEARLRRYIIESSSNALCMRWAEVVDGARRNARPISTTDAWVAATALHFGVPLITHNKNHFLNVDGLTIISES